MKHIVRFGFIAFFGAALLASCTAQVDMSEDPEQEQVGMENTDEEQSKNTRSKQSRSKRQRQ